MNEFQKVINTLKDLDSTPWYWVEYQDENEYGSKLPGMYYQKVVAAVPTDGSVKPPTPGSKLWYKRSGKHVGTNDVEMTIVSEMVETFSQDGVTLCKFISQAHAFHVLGWIER